MSQVLQFHVWQINYFIVVTRLNVRTTASFRSSPSQSLQRKRQSAAKVAHQFKARIAEKQAMLKHQAEEMRDKMLEEAGGGAGTGLSNGQAQEQNVDLVIGGK